MAYKIYDQDGILFNQEFYIDNEGRLSIGQGESIDNSAILELSSSTRGFSLPRMTNVQRDAISNPLIGLMIWSTDDSDVYVNTGTPSVPIWSNLIQSGVTTGSGINNEVAVWSGSNSLDGDSNFTFDGTTLNVPNLTVNGTTTTINSTVVTINDPIFQIGENSVNDSKDRGISFLWNDGSAKEGFFGMDESTGRFSFIPDAVNTSEVFSGSLGDIEVQKAFLSDIQISTSASDGYFLKSDASGNGSWSQITPSDINGSLISIGDNVSLSTAKSVLFVGAMGELQQDNVNFAWDNTNDRLGIGINVPASKLHVKSISNLLRLESTSAVGKNYLDFYDPSGEKGYIGYGSTVNDNFIIANKESGGKIQFLTTNSMGASSTGFVIDENDEIEMSSLSGTGTRMVVADATGVLSTQVINTGGSLTIGDSISGGTLNTTLREDASNTLATGTLLDDGSVIGVGALNPTSSLNIENNLSNGIRVVNTKTGALAKGAVFSAQGASNSGNNIGISVGAENSSAENIGGIFTAAAGQAGGTTYAVQLSDGSETTLGGKFLKDTGSGKANWASITASDISGITSSQWTTDTNGINYNSGNVGIGMTTSSVNTKLEINYSDIAGRAFRIKNTDDSSQYNFRTEKNGTEHLLRFDSDNTGISPLVVSSANKVGIGTNSLVPEATLHIYSTSGSQPIVLVEDEANPDATPFVIDIDGKVGIGTDAPTAKLEVNGGGKFKGTIISDTTSDAKIKLYTATGVNNNRIEYNTDTGAIRGYHGFSGASVFTHSFSGVTVNFATSAFNINATSNIGINSNGVVTIESGGANAIVANSSQNVSIPNGNLSIPNGTVTIGGGNPASGKYLKSTDANGLAEWSNISTSEISGIQGTLNQVAYFSGTDLISGDTGFLFDGTHVSIGEAIDTYAKVNILSDDDTYAIHVQNNYASGDSYSIKATNATTSPSDNYGVCINVRNPGSGDAYGIHEFNSAIGNKNDEVRNYLSSRLTIGKDRNFGGTPVMLSVDSYPNDASATLTGYSGESAGYTGGYDEYNITRSVDGQSGWKGMAYLSARKSGNDISKDDFTYITLNAGNENSNRNFIGVIGVTGNDNQDNSNPHRSDMFFGVRGNGESDVPSTDPEDGKAHIQEGIRIIGGISGEHISGSTDEKINAATVTPPRVRFGGSLGYTFPAEDGTSGDVLTTNGSGEVAWGSGGSGSSGGLTSTYQSGAAYTASSGDLVVAGNAALNVRLPSAAAGIIIGVKSVVVPTTMSVTTTSSSETIDGIDRSVTGEPVNNQWDYIEFVTYSTDGGSNWKWLIR